ARAGACWACLTAGRTGRPRRINWSGRRSRRRSSRSANNGRKVQWFVFDPSEKCRNSVEWPFDTMRVRKSKQKKELCRSRGVVSSVEAPGPVRAQGPGPFARDDRPFDTRHYLSGVNNL